MAKILVLEDDLVINQVVCEFLRDSSHDVLPLFDGGQALEEIQKMEFDLLILDIMVPTMTGLELLTAVRKISSVPVLVLTALSDEYTQLISFNQDISDFVTKPFSPLVLMKRIENILKVKHVDETIRIGDILIDQQAGYVHVGEQEVQLTKKEYEVFLYLAKRKGNIVSRDNLMMGIWGYTELDSRVLDNHIKNIRKKLPSLHLKTVVGRGYQIEEG
ncbi:TPA: response regulator transcription factor [Streptococcus suis]|uniref:response regulator transcription factor n=1 Tax=Streptococcus suis TaxID=1307 RepID=UPI0005CDC476|nr:response regulator transcription factor [Streptococcus suis]NQH00547.1 response regulator transcription factor [Streptococcus suis]CYW07306.1 winged helix family two component transcriptional regulator [Streptococcus suis]HEM5081981.1 response regulator transcription factor [Streptococcus suis]